MRSRMCLVYAVLALLIFVCQRTCGAERARWNERSKAVAAVDFSEEPPHISLRRAHIKPLEHLLFSLGWSALSAGRCGIRSVARPCGTRNVERRYSTPQLSVSKPEQNLLLLSAQARARSKARAEFASAVDEKSVSAFKFAVLVACEERADDPKIVFAEIDRHIEGLVKLVRARLSLCDVFGEDRSQPITVVKAVSQTLFGVEDGRQEQKELAYFKGAEADYYDPKNSFIDDVLRRKVGIPISLALIYAEVCARLGFPMVGLNAPMHLILAPEDESLEFTVDAYNHGRILSIPEASAMIASNARMSMEQGKIFLRTLRKRPMTSQMWVARLLRNLLQIYTSQSEIVGVVGVLGVSERLRMIGQAYPEASTRNEQTFCSIQMVRSIFRIKWKERLGEMKKLLLQELHDKKGDGLSPEILDLLHSAAEFEDH